MFTKLLVALDGSPCAERAFELAMRLAKLEGSRLILCSVADPAPVYGSLQPNTLIEHTLEEIHQEAERVAGDAAVRAKAAGIVAEACVFEGEPVHQIVSHAAAAPVDGIVIGTHGRSGFARLFMGSVAEGVLRDATVPVIVVRAEASLAPLAPDATFITRVLVPVDGSENSLRAIDVAVELAASAGAEVVVGHAINLGEAAMLSGGEAQLLAGCLELVKEKGQHVLAEALARIGNRVPASSQIGEGEPVEAIAQLVAEVKPEFVVCGSHGRTGLNRAFMGSVAESVLRHAPVPVIVVPAKSINSVSAA